MRFRLLRYIGVSGQRSLRDDPHNVPVRRRVTSEIDCSAMPVPEMARREITSLGYSWRRPHTLV
jgi:hypothetical protein